MLHSARPRSWSRYAALGALTGCLVMGATLFGPPPAARQPAVRASSPTPASPASSSAEFSFEHGFQGWEIDGEMPYFPCLARGAPYPECESPGARLERLWLIRRSAEQGAHGSWSLKMTLDGLSDDGTVWIVRRFDVAPNTHYRVTLSFELGLLRAAPVNAWPVVAHVGSTGPRHERDFTIVGHTGAGDGWVTFTHATDATSDESGHVWVACGVSVTWETWRTFYLDHVSVHLFQSGREETPF